VCYKVTGIKDIQNRSSNKSQQRSRQQVELKSHCEKKHGIAVHKFYSANEPSTETSFQFLKSSALWPKASRVITRTSMFGQVRAQWDNLQHGR